MCVCVNEFMPVVTLFKCTRSLALSRIQLTLMMYLHKIELDGEASNLWLRLANIKSIPSALSALRRGTHVLEVYITASLKICLPYSKLI